MPRRYRQVARNGAGPGIDHDAIVVILSMGIGLFTPPFGVGYYMTCAIGQVDPDEGMKPIWGYILALFIGILILAAVPWLSIGFP